MTNPPMKHPPLPVLILIAITGLGLMPVGLVLFFSSFNWATQGDIGTAMMYVGALMFLLGTVWIAVRRTDRRAEQRQQNEMDTP